MHHIRIYYYPQCPWIVPTIYSIKEVSKKLGYEFSVHDLLNERLNVNTLFKVCVDERVVPIGIGITDQYEVGKRLLNVGVDFREQETTEIIPLHQHKSKTRTVKDVKINPINFDNIDDEINLCVGQDFLYGPIPQNFLKEAKELKRKWLRHILSNFGSCGYIAYVLKEAVGFVEFVPGDFANKLGIKTNFPPNCTAIILCLSVKRACWGLKIGSKLLNEMSKDLRATNYRYVELIAYKSGVWHPVNFYLKNNFKIVKDLGNSVQMAYQL